VGRGRRGEEIKEEDETGPGVKREERTVERGE